MPEITTRLTSLYNQMSRDIEVIRASGEVAPDGVHIVPYSVTRGDILYEYYKLVAPEPIFEGKDGKKTKTKHLGDYRNQKYRKAQLCINRRRAIKILESQQTKLKEMLRQPWHSLVESAKRSRN